MPHIPDRKAAIAIIDELGRLDDEITIFSPKIARAASLRKILQGYCVNDPADEKCTLEGNHYAAVLSAKARKHVIRNMQKLYKLLGLKTFLEYCDFPLKNLERLNVDTTGIVVEERIGPRAVQTARRNVASADKVA